METEAETEPQSPVKPNYVVKLLLEPSYSLMSLTDSVIRPAVSHLRQGQDLESSVLRALLRLEEDFNVYYNIWTKEMEFQRIAADKLWHLTQHYMIFMQMDTSCKCPQNYAIESEELIINKYHSQYQIIMNSNKALRVAITEIRPDLLHFRKEWRQLNMEEETPFIVGDAFHKPLKFFIDLVEELFNYFHAGHLKLDCASRQMDPLELNSVENYQKLLAPLEEFEEYMKHNLSYCRCLCLPTRCQPQHPQTKLKDVSENAKRAQKKRCAQRLNRIVKGDYPEPDSTTQLDSNFDFEMTSQLVHQDQIMSNIMLAFTPSQVARRTPASQNFEQ